MTHLTINARVLAAAMCMGCMPACVHWVEKGADDSGATGSESESDADASGSSAGATESSATDPGASDSSVTESSVTEPGATESSITESSPTESGDTGPGGTEDPPAPAECTAPAPGVSAAFSIEGDWISDDEALRPCTVEAVELEPDTIVTALTCDFGGSAVAVTIRVAAAAEGPPTWKAGDAVHLRSWQLADAGISYQYWLIEMRHSADDALLLLALQGEVWRPEALAPLTLGAAFPCGPEAGFGEGDLTPFQLDFELAGSTLGLLQGQRGALSLPESQAFAIDVEEANTNNCCDYIRWHKFLVRRVTTQ